jgi:hypothetical protein
VRLVNSQVAIKKPYKPVLNEFYRIAFRKKVYHSINELQADLDAWMCEYNEARPHQGRWCFGRTPMKTFLDAIPMTREKMIAAYRTPIAQPGTACQIEYQLILRTSRSSNGLGTSPTTRSIKSPLPGQHDNRDFGTLPNITG